MRSMQQEKRALQLELQGLQNIWRGKNLILVHIMSDKCSSEHIIVMLFTNSLLTEDVWDGCTVNSSNRSMLVIF